ncbi:MAG: hypothetical protein PVJ15_01350 [Gammaproteobacteria bacterium]
MSLLIPKLKKPGNRVFNTRADAVRRWVENLPLINTEGTVIQLEFALDNINSTELPSEERVEILELLTAPVMFINGALRKKYLGKPLPLEGDPLNKATKAIDLCTRMATGYKILVVALEKRSLGNSLLATAVQRAMRYLSEILIGNYQIYVQYPEGIWRDLHTLYALAERQGLQQLPVIDTTLAKPAASTIGDIYKQILLLSLASPFRLRQNEIRQVYDTLGQWTPYCKLGTIPQLPNGLFGCHLDSDEPPCYRIMKHHDQLDEQWRILDTGGMTAPVQTALAESRVSASHPGLPEQQILNRVMLSWGVMPKRRFPRHQQPASISMVTGLRAIHCILTGLDSGGSFDESVEMDIIRDKQYLQDPTFERPTRISTANMHRYPARPDGRQSGNGTRSTTRQGHPLQGAYLATGNVGDGNSAGNPRIETWTMQDMSAGGYCLLWEGEGPSSVRIGELVAIHGGDDTQQVNWQLGVIRWMKFTQERGFGLGVQLMSPGAKPVLASIRSNNAAAENKMHGILLPEIKAINQQASLLLPSLPFRSGSLSTLSWGADEEQIRLTRLIENTGSFAQFHFTPADEKG